MIYIGVDCDLHRIHAICSQCGVICKEHPDPMQVLMHAELHTNAPATAATILFEIASPQAYRDGKAAHYNLAKWMLFNMAIATWIQHERPPRTTMLVSPSSKWTKGYEAKARHAMAKAKASTHDLREAESMIAFHALDPTQWTTYKDYIHGL